MMFVNYETSTGISTMLQVSSLSIEIWGKETMWKHSLPHLKPGNVNSALYSRRMTGPAEQMFSFVIDSVATEFETM